MPLKDYNIVLNLKETPSMNLVKVVQNDTNSNRFNITLIDNNKRVDLTGATSVTCTVLKPDNTFSIGSCSIVDAINGRISYILTAQCVNVPGMATVTIEVYTGTARMTSASMMYEITEELVNDSALTSMPEYPLLQQLMSDIQIIQQTEDGRETAEVERESNELSRQDQELFRQQQETNRANSETARVNAETARVNAEGNRANAETSRVQADQLRETKLAEEFVNEPYDNGKLYKKGNKVVSNGSSYRLQVDTCQGVLPSSDPAKWLCIASKGADGLGAGDMLKISYDSDDDGKVNYAEAADSVEWTGVQNKPATFPPAAHNHDSAYLGITATAADAAKLGGVNASEYVTNTAISTTVEDIAPLISLPNTAKEGVLQGILKGRTVWNIFGSDGNCEDLSKWAYAMGSASTNSTLSTTQKMFGANSIKFVNSNENHGRAIDNIRLDSAKYYMASIYFFIESYTSGSIRISISDTGGWLNPLYGIANNTLVGKWQRVAIKFTGKANARFAIINGAASTLTAYYDGAILNEITADEYNNLTLGQLLDKYPYVDGLRSVEDVRVRSVGKNLVKNGNGEEALNYWDKTSNALKYENGYFSKTNNNGYDGYQEIKVKPNTAYTLSALGYNANVGQGASLIAQPRDKAGNILSPTIALDFTSNATPTKRTSSNTFPQETAYVRIYQLANVTTFYFKEVQLEEGITATAYEPYESTEAYINWSGRTLPNGVFDEMKLAGDGMRRTGEKVLANADITDYYTALTNVDYVRIIKPADYKYATVISPAVGSFKLEGINEKSVATGVDNAAHAGYVTADTSPTAFLYFVAKGTYANLAAAQAAMTGKKLLYELANPVPIELEGIETVLSKPSGTIYIEPYYKFTASLNAGVLTTPNTALTIKSVESLTKIRKLDNGDIERIPATVASFTTTTITPSNLDTTAQYEAVYEYDNALSTIPTLSYTYNNNLSAVIEGHTKAIEELGEAASRLNDKTTTPICKVTRNSNMSVANNTATLVPFNVINFDTDNIYNSAVSTTRLIIKTAGIYQITALTVWDIGTSGVRIMGVLYNGADYALGSTEAPATSNGYPRYSASALMNLAAGDYLELTVTHTQGSAINLAWASLGIVKVG